MPTEIQTAPHASAPDARASRVDGRTLRATGRTVQFTTRITSDLQAEIKLFAAQHDLQINELLEQSFAALKREMQR